jgi:Fe-S cluster biogenesis protein NfuA
MTARERIEAVLESIRPAIQADGGDVELIQVDESAGTVKVRLMGACESCPISMMTLKEGIETRVKRAVPGIVEVTAV